MMCLYVENRRWEYNPGIFFLTTLAPAYIRWAMWTIQEILLSSVSLGILHYTAMWGGQGDQHVRGQEREKKVSVSVADSYQMCWACHLRIFERQDTEIAHWWESWKCTWGMSLLQRNTKSTCLCVSVCLPPSKSVKYQIRAAQQLPKVSCIEALVLLFGDLWAAARAVSLCKTCDTVTGGHCQAGLSQRVLRFRDRNSQTERERASAHIRRLNERRTVVLRFKSLSPEIW